MNLTHHRTNSKCVLARFTESEILDVLTRAVAVEAGIDLNDPAVEVRTRDLARALPSATHAFEAVIDINIDMSAPPSSAATVKLDQLAGLISEATLSEDVISKIVELNGCTTTDQAASLASYGGRKPVSGEPIHAACEHILGDSLFEPFKVVGGKVYGPRKVASTGHAYIDGIKLGVDGSALLNVCTYVDHQKMPHNIRSVATLADGRPQWEISKDGTIRVGNTTHLPDGTIRQEGPYPFTMGPL